MFSQTQQSLWYVIYWPWATCFDYIGIIIRASLKIQIHYIELLKHVMASQTFTANLCSQYKYLCFLTIW